MCYIHTSAFNVHTHTYIYIRDREEENASGISKGTAREEEPHSGKNSTAMTAGASERARISFVKTRARAPPAQQRGR